MIDTRVFTWVTWTAILGFSLLPCVHIPFIYVGHLHLRGPFAPLWAICTCLGHLHLCGPFAPMLAICTNVGHLHLFGPIWLFGKANFYCSFSVVHFNKLDWDRSAILFALSPCRFSYWGFSSLVLPRVQYRTLGFLRESKGNHEVTYALERSCEMNESRFDVVLSRFVLVATDWYATGTTCSSCCTRG
jgi:hypothetical protein